MVKNYDSTETVTRKVYVCEGCQQEFYDGAAAKICEVRHICTHEKTSYYYKPHLDRYGAEDITNIDIFHKCTNCYFELGVQDLDLNNKVLLAQIYQLISQEKNC